MNANIRSRYKLYKKAQLIEGFNSVDDKLIAINWEIVKIFEIASSVIAGATPSTRQEGFWDGDIPWMSSGEINLRYVYSTEKKITREGYESTSTRYIPENSVLIALAGQGQTRGRVAINKIRLCTNQSLCAIVPNEKVDYRYLFFNIESRYDELRKLSTGDGGRGGLNLQIIKSLDIHLPPLTEQQKIAEILSNWDKAVLLKEQLIEEKKKQKTWLMKKLLTGEVRLPGFEDEWEEVRIGKVLKERIETKCNDLELLAITSKNGIVKRTEVDIKDNSNDDKSKYKRICPLDIGYNTMRMWQGVSSVSEYEGIVSPAYTILTPTEKVDSYFMGYLFKEPKMVNIFWRHSQGMVDDTLNLKYSNLKTIKVIIPKDVKEQRAIAQLLKTIDKNIEYLGSELEALKLQKKGLMQLLLTGIVRVQC